MIDLIDLGDDRCKKIYTDAYGNIQEISYYKGEKLDSINNNEPAVLIYDDDGRLILEEYWKEHLRHREDDKPAYIYYNKDGSIFRVHYFYNDVLIDDDVLRRKKLKERNKILNSIK